jgi:uncharacterized caspase-like protein/TPR repeat protein
MLALLLAMVLPIGAAAAEKRVALVIGNAAYRNTTPLPNPKNDASDVATALQVLGFETILETDLDKRGMDDAFRRFARLAREADAALFFYAGHGMQFAGSNYLMPVDAKLQDETDLSYEMARVDDVIADLARARNIRILILDACRDNPLADRLRASLPADRSAIMERGLRRPERTHGLITAFATQPGQTAKDGVHGERNSPFTSGFLKHVSTPGMEAGMLFRRVAQEVSRATGGRQLPELSISLLGEFYFAGPGPRGPHNDASHVWSVIQATTSLAVLEDFVRQFGDTPFGSMARARLTELRKSQTAAFPGPPATPPAVVTPPPAPTAPPSDSAAKPPLPAGASTLAGLPQPASPPSPISSTTNLRALEIGPAEPRDTTPATECDHMVALREDWERVPSVAGRLSGARFVVAKALAACRTAIAQYPHSRRLKVQLSRTLEHVDNAAASLDERRTLVIEAVRAGSLDAVLSLAQMARSGLGVRKDFRLAIALSEAAGDRGHRRGYEWIASIHYQYQDFVEGNRWIERAVAAGNTEAMITVGNNYSSGRGVTANYDDAEWWYRRALEAGNPRAYRYLGQLALKRAEGKKTVPQMVECLEKGAAAGDPEAASELGSKYLDGEGVAKDLAKAQSWFERATALGYPNDFYELAKIAVSGGKQPEKTRQAFGYLDRQRDYGMNPSFQRALLYHYDLEDEAKALEHYRKAADEDPQAGYYAEVVGRAYENGEGVRKDLLEARRWYERAAESKTRVWALARFYKEGLGGLNKDLEKAAELMMIGIANDDWYSKYYLIDQRGRDVERTVILAIQQKLRALGLLKAPSSGVVDEATVLALTTLRNPFMSDITDEQIVAAR